MTRRSPISSVEDLSSLDDAEILEGYFDGFKNEPCGDNRSRSYWHGWRNGMTDAGHAKGDSAQATLAREYLKDLGDKRASALDRAMKERAG